MTSKTQRPLTGRTVMAITVGAFGVVLTANMALLWAALGSFPGLEVANSYVASQSFDRERVAQNALGWNGRASYRPGILTLDLNGRDGAAVEPSALQGRVGRATHVKDDQVLSFAPGKTGYEAPALLAPGHWQVWIKGEAPDGTPFRQRLSLFVAEAE